MKKAVRYSVAVCLFSWGIYALLMLCMGDVISKVPVLLTLFKSVYMFFPMVVAVILQMIDGEKAFPKGTFALNLSWYWLPAILCPIIAVLLSVPMSALVPGVSLHVGAEQLVSMNGLDEATAAMVSQQLAAVPVPVMIIATVIESIIAGVTINALFAFGEEYGWRGYLVSAMKGQSFVKAALFIGFVWGIWHMPLILGGHNYPQHPVAGVLMMCIFCILVGFIELYFRILTGSVLVAACIHGVINGLSGIVLLLVLGGNDLTVGLPGAAGFAALALVCGIIWYIDTRPGGKRILISQIQ